MRSWFVPLLAAVGFSGLLVAGCTQAAPSPTAVPAAPTKAAASAPAAAPASAPTVAPAAPTKAPEPTKVPYPEKGKSVTVIVPWAAGGTTDIGARVLASAMEKDLGVPMQIVNKPGASSQVGITDLAKSKPDGYTIGWTNLPSIMGAYLDPSRQAAFGRKDLVQVSNVVADPETFSVKTGSKYKLIKDLIDDAKARPEQVKVGIGGFGSPDHLSLLILQELAGVKFSIVNFADGGPPLIAALLGDHVDVGVLCLGNYSAQLKSGTVHFLTVLDDQRSSFPAVKDVPTLKEQGYNLAYLSSRGISVPGGTPKEVVNVLDSSVKKAMANPDVKQKFDDMLLGIRYLNAEQYSRYWDEFETLNKPFIEKAMRQQ